MMNNGRWRKTSKKPANRLPLMPGWPGLHPEILKILGRLKYRTSYGQNQLSHAVEVAKLAAVIASELGADMEVCKAGALLHDLGKAMDHNTEGTHAIHRRGVCPPLRGERQGGQLHCLSPPRSGPGIAWKR